MPAASTEPATEDSTPMNSDGPTAAAIWINVFRMVTPCGFCSGESVCNPAVWEGESARPTPAYTITELLPLYFEGALGTTALAAGALLLAPILVNAVTSLVGGRIMDKRRRQHDRYAVQLDLLRLGDVADERDAQKRQHHDEGRRRQKDAAPAEGGDHKPAHHLAR